MTSTLSINSLEEQRINLIIKRNNSSFPHLFISDYNSYFLTALKFNNPNVAEAFLQEFIDEFKYAVSKIGAFGTDIDFIANIVNQLKEIFDQRILFIPLSFLKDEILKLQNEVIKLGNILDGKEHNITQDQKAAFPLIYKKSNHGFYGIVESVTVRINKSSSSNKFIIVPSEKKIEENIFSQCKNSWELAVSISKRFVKKTNEFHEVILSFDKKEGFYEGNSLGIALTFSFLEEILKFYNPTYTINLIGKIAFTGGINTCGEIQKSGNEIIEQKINTLFYSDSQVFIFHKDDEIHAKQTLHLLNNKYPNRKLRIESFDNIEAILNRRDLVEIKKQNPIIRSTKFIKKNWISAVSSLILSILFAYLFVVDWDDNPYTFYADGNSIYIKNKNGRTIWSFKSHASPSSLKTNYACQFVKIVDVNNDGSNEVISSLPDYSINKTANTPNAVTCFDKNKKIIWTYQFKDTVKTHTGHIAPDYGGYSIIDTTTLGGKKSIFLVSSSVNSFSSAIYGLELKTGKRLPGTFWASGHIVDGMVKDIEQDGKKEIIGIGYDNGFEDLVFFVYDLDTLKTVRLTSAEYLISNFPVRKMKAYIRIQKTDYDKYIGVRTPTFNIGSFYEKEESQKFCLATSIGLNQEEPAIGYEINPNLKDIDIVITSTYRVKRDSLVVHGKLKLPFTDTEEYCNILKSQIKYWNGKEFVSREQLQ
ncbi:MAG: hypothetical protein IPM32_14300 [Ignavibacteriae bacterium]|nr:hypothetical protein [Ignavibacteriota bacterium]